MSNLVKLNDIILDGFGQTAGEGFDLCDLLGEPIQTSWGLWSATINNKLETTFRIEFDDRCVFEIDFWRCGADFNARVTINGDRLTLERGVEKGLVVTFLEFTNTSDETLVEIDVRMISEHQAEWYISYIPLVV
jgi:hypothetical protein